METLVARLEAAVSRLETIESKLGLQSTSSSSVPAIPRESALLPSITASAASGDNDSPNISEYDQLLEKSFGRVLGAAEKIGGQVLESTLLLKSALAVHRDFLLKIKKCKQPDVAGLTRMLQPLNETITKANALTEGKRTESFNHLKTVAESLTVFVWVAYSGKDCGLSLPAAHVEESWQTAEFYNNKVLVEYKNKDGNHVEWAKAMKELYVPSLRDYVRKFYPTGPVWNPSGVDVGSFSQNPAPSKTTKAGGPPPPPPRPAPFVPTEVVENPKENMNAVFQQINAGESVTAGLRKVTNEMKTKNRPDRSGFVTVGSGKDKSVSSSHSVPKTGPPKLELQMGRKWIVENQIGQKNLVLGDCDPKQSVYIFGCKDSVLQIKGKVNNITVDKCTKTGVVFMDVVSACEIVNCNGIEVQCQGTAPTIAVDNTSGCQLYLGRESLGTSITTAKSSEVNVLIPGATDDADLVEHPLPEQFTHAYKDGQFVTSAVSHSGG
uniref:Adenylyl cyclase-associated protein n=1 Tax=Wollemia nobilis TaxID=56998 RepID=A0A0C9RUY9_9CONI